MRRPRTATQVEALSQALSEGTRWYYDGAGDDSHYGDLLVRDNALRLLETLQLAERFLRGPKPRVLECGAGSLYAIEALRWRYRDSLELYAIEHPAAARDELAAELAARDVRFAAHDLLADSVPWPELKFDLIILAEVIEHIPPTHVPDMIRRLAGCLSSHGALVLSSPNSQAISNVLSLAVGNGQMLDVAFPPKSGSYGHIRMYSRKEVEQLFDYAGLRLCEWSLTNWSHDQPWPGAAWRDRVRLGVQRITPKVVPRWSSGWICTATPSLQTALDGG
jgi:cyclopropane fatty-acyl-phospholipid synthase-like methyltransferase